MTQLVLWSWMMTRADDIKCDCILPSEQHERFRGVEPVEGERRQDVRLRGRRVPENGVRGGGPSVKEGLHRQRGKVCGEPHYRSHGLTRGQLPITPAVN